MIEFTKPVDEVRRLTFYARSDGEWQWNIYEASVFSWTDNWLVTAIQGSELEGVKLEYPQWLSHVCRGLTLPSPEARSFVLGDQYYSRNDDDPTVEFFESAKEMVSHLNWVPSAEIIDSGSAWVASYFPPGRITLPP